MAGGGLDWRVEQACFNAWPALSEVLVGDWICRRAPDVSRRSNSANPLRIDPGATSLAIEACEAVYRHWKAPVIFRIPSLIGPEMERELDRRGYSAEGDTLTLYGDVGDTLAAPDVGVEIEPRASEEWLRAKSAMMGFNPRQDSTYRAALDRLGRPAGFAALREQGRMASVAYGVLDGQILCLEGVVAYAALRGRGLGRRMVAALIDWAHARGASGICLQVEADNEAALRLYRSLGLTQTLYRYRYRRGPAGVS